MVGGDAAAIARAKPLLEIMGKHVFHLGPIGCGDTMKAINNTITAVALEATAEGLVLGKRLGLDPNVITDVLNVSTGMSRIRTSSSASRTGRSTICSSSSRW